MNAITYSGWSLLYESISGGYSSPSTLNSSLYYVWGKDLSGTLDGAGGVGGLLAVHISSNNNRSDLQDFQDLQDLQTSATRSAGGGTWYFPLYDNNGNVTDYVSETGEVVASYAYDAFGRTIAKSGAMADSFPFRFSTKYYDAESGLYYYGYRYYSPELGRWLTRDPIEEDGGDNLYAFCGNNGVDRYDALGKHLTISTTKDPKGTTIQVSLQVSFQLLVCPDSFEQFRGYHKQVAAEIKRRWTQSVVTNGVTYSLSFLAGGIATRIGKIGDPKTEQGNYHTFKLVKKHSGTHWGKRNVSHTTIGGMVAEIYIESHRDLETYVHEFGHWLGLDDQYVVIDTGKYDIHSGKQMIYTRPKKGYANHIMGDGGEKVSAEEIKFLSELSPDKYNIR